MGNETHGHMTAPGRSVGVICVIHELKAKNKGK